MEVYMIFLVVGLIIMIVANFKLGAQIRNSKEKSERNEKLLDSLVDLLERKNVLKKSISIDNKIIVDLEFRDNPLLRSGKDYKCRKDLRLLADKLGYKITTQKQKKKRICVTKNSSEENNKQRCSCSK